MAPSRCNYRVRSWPATGAPSAAQRKYDKERSGGMPASDTTSTCARVSERKRKIRHGNGVGGGVDVDF